jgi:hypothetical protein
MSDWKRAWEGDWSQINEEQQARTRPQEQKTHPGHTKARERDEWPDALEGSGRDTANAGEDLRPITRIATRRVLEAERAELCRREDEGHRRDVSDQTSAPGERW